METGSGGRSPCPSSSTDSNRGAQMWRPSLSSCVTPPGRAREHRGQPFRSASWLQTNDRGSAAAAHVTHTTEGMRVMTVRPLWERVCVLVSQAVLINLHKHGRLQTACSAQARRRCCVGNTGESRPSSAAAGRSEQAFPLSEGEMGASALFVFRFPIMHQCDPEAGRKLLTPSAF